MSIQHFAAAPGQIISFLLSCCVKSPAGRPTLLIAGGEEPRRAALLPSEADRGRERAAVRSALALFLCHLSLLCRRQVCFSSGRLTRMRRFAVKSELRCAAHGQRLLDVPDAVFPEVNVKHNDNDENHLFFIFLPAPNNIILFVLTGQIIRYTLPLLGPKWRNVLPFPGWSAWSAVFVQRCCSTDLS